MAFFFNVSVVMLLRVYLFPVYPCMQIDRMLQCLTNMEFKLLLNDIPMLLSCRSEMLILLMALVIKQYVRFASLSVQTVHGLF